jgi:hypothetical protein
MLVLCLVVVLDVLSLYLPAKLFSWFLTGLLDSARSTCVSPFSLCLLGVTRPLDSMLLIFEIPCPLELGTVVFSLDIERVMFLEPCEGSLLPIIEGLFLVGETDVSLFGALDILLISEVLVVALGLVDGVRGMIVFLPDDEGRGLLEVLGFIIDVFELRVTELT